MKNRIIPATLTLKNKTKIHYAGNVRGKKSFFYFWPFEDDKGQKYIVRDYTIDDYKVYHKLLGRILQIDYDSHYFNYHLYALKVKDFSPDVKEIHDIK